MRTVLIRGLEYVVSEHDLIYKRRGKGFVKSFPDKDGYLKYAFSINGKTLNISVHKFVWELYNGPILDGMTVDHIDNNKLNNHISNLQLLSSFENVEKGNARYWIAIDPVGSKHQVYNLSKFCKEHNLNRSHMYGIAKGYRNQSHHKGWTCYERN